MNKKFSLDLFLALAMLSGFIVSKLIPVIYPQIIPANSKIKVLFEILFYVSIVIMLIRNYINMRKKQ